MKRICFPVTGRKSWMRSPHRGIGRISAHMEPDLSEKDMVRWGAVHILQTTCPRQ